MTDRLNYSSGRDLVIGTHDRLRIARVQAGIEQEEMAEILGVSSSSISNWETGRNYPKKAFLNAWAQVTGFNLASLLGEDHDCPLEMAGARENATSGAHPS